MDRKAVVNGLKMVLGCCAFALGVDLFLEPNRLNPGGMTGLAMIFIESFHIGSVGSLTVLFNFPLFLVSRKKIGKRFFRNSIIGILLSSVFVDLFARITPPQTEPLLASLFGGALIGFGVGCVFSAGGSTGGTDIVSRLLKIKWRNMPIGTVNACTDFLITLLAGVVFRDFTKTLYSFVAIFVAGEVVDAVVYRFDYSRVALIISECHEEIANAIGEKLERGATFLRGEGSYTHQDTRVILTAVSRRQLAELKELTIGIDPTAFIIVQEAHQVLGDGFARYSREDSL